MRKWVYTFADGMAEGSAADVALLGSKGANLAEMSRIGLPVPPGFTITTDACNRALQDGEIPQRVREQVDAALRHCEIMSGKKFGAITNPLVVSVRSGARVSMPGMMDTVLNLGLNDETVEALSEQSGDERFAYDTYRRFIQMYATVVMGCDHALFEDILDAARENAGASRDNELGAEELRGIVKSYKNAIQDDLDETFPQDPKEQLWRTVEAVFKSWNNPRAATYRALHNIPVEWGTAVTVQAMVFGNSGRNSATGVAFTRNPSTGENVLFGEFLVDAQGEDVVAGFRTPDPLSIVDDKPGASMQERLPEPYKALTSLANDLEQHFGDMQDIEFTVEAGKLWLLQTRAGKRTAKAAIRIAIEMANSDVISRQTALMRVDASSLDQLLHPSIDPDAKRKIIASGLPASPGAACGEIVFSSADAVAAKAEGRDVILVRPETSPDDIQGMEAAVGILTSRGGMTSHAAVVARGMGKPCITGAGGMRIDKHNKALVTGGVMLRSGDYLTLDGNQGQVLEGKLPMVDSELSGDFATLMEWSDAERRLKVRTNADTPTEARVARNFQADGIGLCRTEHMFAEGERSNIMREMIVAETEEERRAVLDRLMPMQRSDFIELFEIMQGHPIAIRLFDPPLHDFLPKEEEAIRESAKTLGIDSSKMMRRVEELREINPMLGNRGVRLAICFPEIAEMQTRAIFEAAILAGKKSGELVVPEIVVPLVAYNAELEYIRTRIDKIADEVMASHDQKIEYLVGCIIELPRAAIRAELIAQSADFLSFGTNDLTQTTLGISRDDASTFLSTYLRKGVIQLDPFINLDVEGVGELMRIATERGRKTEPELLLGITGEHGGDPTSITFCEKLGLDYVSCSPYRVPIARLAAAQAAISKKAG
ncbi:pyruvate, phosphate dikinase [Ahrensia marina]|uniref:Pyruvate, phosphate dikinase n=1 Tax=Ahrensia marina TaxID=1514904 RepID=A0A0N0E7I9_9HYPH|nr:pyruvate, phosphate dikinase [Ahrensia marina]KPB01212.1 pyruvate phosphate dikinase [Ahrensia marina]